LEKSQLETAGDDVWTASPPSKSSLRIRQLLEDEEEEDRVWLPSLKQSKDLRRQQLV